MMVGRYGFAIDLERCVGCDTCTIACMVEHDLHGCSGISVETIGGPDRDTPGVLYSELQMHFLPVLCMHCGNAPCMEACPIDAIYRRQDGIVLIDNNACDNCQVCIESCPHDAIASTGDDIPWKCNMCVDRIEAGIEPFCVLCCESEAIFFGDLDNPESIVSKMIAQRKGQVLLENTAPAVWYCPTRTGRVK